VGRAPGGSSDFRTLAGVRRVNVFAAGLEYDAADPGGYGAGMARFGPQLGSSMLGATIYPPLLQLETRRRWLDAELSVRGVAPAPRRRRRARLRRLLALVASSGQ
jgi:hypothetical protein